MAATAAITIHKIFTYRGEREPWDNTHHVDTVPANTNAWYDLGEAIWNLEKTFLSADVSLLGFSGYMPGETHASYEYQIPDRQVNGAWVPATGEVAQAGDTAMWVRWGTTQKTVRGKPIFLRSYYHDVHTGLSKDQPSANQQSGLNNLGSSFVAGLAATGQVYHRSGPNGAIAQNHDAGEWITTRTLKRRGKRKKPTAATTEKVFEWWLKNVTGPLPPNATIGRPLA